MTDKSAINKMLATLKKADTAYFNSGKPIMTDKEYDALLASLVKLTKKLQDPKVTAAVEKYMESTGAEETGGEKVDLPFYLASLDKLKTDEPKAIDRYIERNLKAGASQFLIGPKYDGSSILLGYSKGKLVSANTRGNGNVGRNVLTHAKVLVSAGAIPATIPDKRELRLRCELCITRAAFKPWAGKTIGGRVYNEARNAVNGFLTAKSFDKEFASCLSVVAFDLTDPHGAPVEATKLAAVKLLASWGFSPMFANSYKLVSGDSIKPELDKMLAKVSSSKFEIECDGVVIEANKSSVRKLLRKGREDRRPYFAMAYKYGVTDDVTAQWTRVTDVTWTAASDGARVPNVVYEPIKVGNTTLTAALLHNAENLEKLGISVGSRVKVVRSGGVIPQVIEVDPKVKPKTPCKIPKKCVCGALLKKQGPDLYCTEPNRCHQTRAAKLQKAVDYLDVNGLGARGVDTLVDFGIDYVATLFNTPVTKLKKVLGESAGTKVSRHLAKLMDTMSWVDWMVISGAFIRPGMSLGSTKLEEAAELLDMGDDFDPFIYKGKAITLKKKLSSMGKETAELFASNYDRFLAFLNDFE